MDDKREAAAPMQMLTNPESSPVKAEHLSSPPPLVEDTSGILEDGEMDEQQVAVGSHHSKRHSPSYATPHLTCQGELQLSAFEYSSLEDRFKRLEGQHRELQDLASAYSDVIRGFSPAEGQTVSIDQLQAEAGRHGLRAKALEADVLRPLVREAGGLEALIAQTHTMRTLVDKAGGLRKLEQFVSDLRTIRDILDEMTGSQGLEGLVSEVRSLLASQQEHAELRNQVDGPNGLRAKSIRYERLMQAFTDVQTDTSYQQPDAITLLASPIRMTRNTRNAMPLANVRSTGGNQPAVISATMNPARARLISATPFEADPDRDLYEAAPPVAAPRNGTGSNNTPLGAPQAKPASRLGNRKAGSSTLKRKETGNATASVPTKRPRVDIGRASALVQASLTGTTKSASEKTSNQPNIIGISMGVAGFTPPTRTERRDSKGICAGDTVSIPQTQISTKPLSQPDWMGADIRFGSVSFASSSEARMPTRPSTAASQTLEAHANTKSAPARFIPNMLGHPLSFPLMKSLGGVAGTTVSQAASASPDLQSQLSVLKAFFRHPVGLWVGTHDDTSAWDAYQSYDLKRDAQIPDKLLMFLLGELAKHINTGNVSTYEQMAPNRDTCILR